MISKIRSLGNIPNRRALLRCLRRQLSRATAREPFSALRLDVAYEWVAAAQDTKADGGVPAAYDLLRGWSASYPETTGYMIPTMLAYSKLRGRAEARDRALRMADWEIEVQMSSGAVRAGPLSQEPAPAVFNTGQVLFGWVAAYRETQNDAYRKAATRAAQWLLEVQDQDGAWRRNLSPLTNTSVHTHNVRSAWGLALAGRDFNEPAWTEAARRNCDWALSQQDSDGWFENCGLDATMPPLLHTIAYTLEGLLAMGQLLGDERYALSARAGAKPLADRFENEGSLPGLFERGWKPAASWTCVVGNAQTAIVLLRLANWVSGCESYGRIGRDILAEVARTQDIESPRPETRGAIPGADPIWGAYMHWSYPNWAVKFFMDALSLVLTDGKAEAAG